MDVQESADKVTAVFRLRDSPESRVSCWPYRFEAVYAISIGRELRLSLSVRNRDTVAFTCEESLHTYCAVGNVNATSVTRMDASGSSLLWTSAGTAAANLEKEISEIHHGIQTAVIDDTVHNRTVVVSTKNSRDSVIWNPGREKASSTPDFDSEGWKNMLCYEPCNIKESAIRLQPGATHRMVVTMSVGGPSLIPDWGSPANQ